MNKDGATARLRQHASALTKVGVPIGVVDDVRRWAHLVDHAYDRASGWNADGLDPRHAQLLLEVLQGGSDDWKRSHLAVVLAQRAATARRELEVTPEQIEVCARFGVQPEPAAPFSKLGIARNVRFGLEPTNGLRHPAEAGTSGWFVWSGEKLEDDADWFEPVHARHVAGIRPEIEKYLALPPGWRFLVATDYEDCWYDEQLLHVEKASDG